MNDRTLPQIERDLKRIGARRKRARAEAAAASEEAKPLIIALADEGYEHKYIAEIGQYNERAIHDILKAAGRTRPKGKRPLA